MFHTITNTIIIQNSNFELIGIFDIMITFLKKVLPKSISSRFFLILATPVIISQIVFGVVFFERYTQNVYEIVSDQMAGDIKVLCRILDSNPEKNFIKDLSEDFKIKIDILNNAKLNFTGLKKRTKVDRMLKSSLDRKQISEYFIEPFASSVRVYVQSADKNDVYKLSFHRKKMYTRIIPIVLGWGFVSSIILMIIAFIFLKNQIRPIKRLAIAAEQFGQGIDTNTFVPAGAREIRMVGRAFCRMKSNFRKVLSDRMKTLAGISHDLRTPLTKMKLQLGMMPKTKENIWLLNDVEMMIKITESFTLHASEQNKEMFIQRNLSIFLKECINDYKSEGFCIYLTGDKSIEADIKHVSLKRAFGNIISNAQKHAKNLYINFEARGEKIYIFFEDDGSGINPEIADDIFVPFIGENIARTHNTTANVGLGLSIARDAITDHGGNITVSKSDKHGGANFVVELQTGM